MSKMEKTKVDASEGELNIFPSITNGENSFIMPTKLRELILFLFQSYKTPKWVRINNRFLIQTVNVVFFEGLDKTYYQKYKECLSVFEKISINNFPINIIAHAKAGQFQPGIQNFLGMQKRKKNPVKFNDYDEMCLDDMQLYDNGFPVKEHPQVNAKLRCQFFKMDPLSDDELGEYSELPDHFDGNLNIISLDCEMIETDLGDECCRLSVVKEDGSVVSNMYLKPLGKIIDLRTDVSGITMEKIEDAKYSSSDVVKIMSEYASKDTIICGHSLENDFRAMKLIHKKVIDTSILYNKDAAFPYKPSLIRLYVKYFKKNFRNENCSHDSIDDARAALDLVKYALSSSNVHCKLSKPTVPDLFTKIKESVSQINVFEPYGIIDYDGIQENIKCHSIAKSEDRLNSFIEMVKNDPPPLTFLHFNELSECKVDEETEKDICQKYNSYLDVIVNNIPKHSILLVYTGNGSLKRLYVDPKTVEPKYQNPGKDPNRKEEFERCRNALGWIYYENKE